MLNIFQKNQKTNSSDRPSLKELAATLLVGAAIVAFWRGVWELLDLYLFPENQLLSAIASMLVGVICLLLMKRFRMDYL
jgi:hypothetical protein